MAFRFVKRKAHPRRKKFGGVTYVRHTWACYETGSDHKRERYRHPCPVCGKLIISVHMREGGWAHFEGRKGLGTVKHPCMHVGEGLSQRRDDSTRDLFEV